MALSEVPVHPPLEGLDFEEILQARPFALEDFEHQPLQLTFIWRSDRFWLNNRLLDFLHKASHIEIWAPRLGARVILLPAGQVTGSVGSKA